MFNSATGYSSLINFDNESNYSIPHKAWILQKIAAAGSGGLTQQQIDDFTLTKMNCFDYLLNRYSD